MNNVVGSIFNVFFFLNKILVGPVNNARPTEQCIVSPETCASNKKKKKKKRKTQMQLVKRNPNAYLVSNKILSIFLYKI